MSTTAVKSDERLAFSERLKRALTTAEIGPGIAHLTRIFNQVTKGSPVTAHAVRKWLLGESIPTQEKMQELAALTRCDASWLRFGTNPDAVSKQAHEFSIEEAIHIRTLRALPEYQRAAVYSLVTSLRRGA